MKKNKAVAIRWHRDGAIFFDLQYCLCINDEQFESAISEIGVRYSDHFVNNGADGTTHSIMKEGRRYSIVGVSVDEEEALDTIGLIVHESVHVFQDIMGAMRECSPGGEIEAYTIQAIARNLIGDWLDMKDKKLTQKRK